MRIASVIVVLVLLFTSGSEAQVAIPGAGDSKTLRQSVFGIGLFAGPASGTGLSFRHHLPSSLSYQITGGVIKASDNLYYSIGAELQYDFILGSASRVFAILGAGYYHSGTADENELDGPARAGLGVGGEFRVFESIHATVEGVFTYFTDGTILPLPQVGLYYYFL